MPPPLALQIPQSVVPSGGQVGIGIRFDCIEEEAIERAEADADVWVEAIAPVRARTTTNARTMFFMVLLLFETPREYLKIVVDLAAESRIGSG